MRIRHVARTALPMIRRLPGPAHTITPLQTGHTVYEVTLSAVPSLAWRAAFVRPPARLRTARYTPDAISLHGTTVIFRTTPPRLPSLAAPDRPLERLRRLGGGGMTRGSR